MFPRESLRRRGFSKHLTKPAWQSDSVQLQQGRGRGRRARNKRGMFKNRWCFTITVQCNRINRRRFKNTD